MDRLGDKSFDFASHMKKHKKIPGHLTSVASGVQRRLERETENRRTRRESAFDNGRDLLAGSPVASVASVVDCKRQHRQIQLEKWKADKALQKKKESYKKKKPFVIGVAHAPLTYVPPPPLKPSVRVTRSQTSRRAQANVGKKGGASFAPPGAEFCAPKIDALDGKVFPTLAPVPKTKAAKNNSAKDNTKEIPLPNEVTLQRRSSSRKIENRMIKPAPTKRVVKIGNTVIPRPINSEQASDNMIRSTSQDRADSKEKQKSSKRNTANASSSTGRSKSSTNSFQKTSPVLKTKSGITTPKSESRSEQRLRSPKSPLTTQLSSIQKISPNITLSRGKENARKETKRKIEEGLLDDDASDVENVEYFRRQLTSEVARLTAACDAWSDLPNYATLEESVQAGIMSAVGQGRLLVSQKLQQFASLIEQCVRPEPGAHLVTPADLHGFWDMVFMQVEDVDIRFKKLEELRARGWSEAAPPAHAKKPAKQAAAKKVARPMGCSRIKEAIAAARKAKKQQEMDRSANSGASAADEGTGACAQVPSDANASPAAEKSFEAGFFTIRSPVRSPAAPRPRTPASPAARSCSLLKSVLSSEASKSAARSSASFAMLRASWRGKNVDLDGVSPLPATPETAAINVNATPGRSILKSANNKSAKKSLKLVLFNDSDRDASSNDNTHTETDVVDDTKCEETDHTDEQTVEYATPVRSTRKSRRKKSAKTASDAVKPHIEVTEPSASDDKENFKSKLLRQDAVDIATPDKKTRRKSALTPKVYNEAQLVRNAWGVGHSPMVAEKKSKKVAAQTPADPEPEEGNESTPRPSRRSRRK